MLWDNLGPFQQLTTRTLRLPNLITASSPARPSPTFLIPRPVPLHSTSTTATLFTMSNDALPPDPTEVLDKLRELVSATHLQNDIPALHIRAMALTARLKSLYRDANTATRNSKDETAAARQEMDQSHLNLQNLLYEKRHLEREIEKCRQFACVLSASC